MSKAKRAQAKEHRIKKKTREFAENHQERRVIHRNKLADLCNQYVWGNIRPKK